VLRDLLDRLLAGTAPGAEPLTHVEELPPRPAVPVEWPPWVPAELRSRLAALGIAAPWAHQAAAAETAFS
jgi:DEAD/DEAH box helicase domain-containing protein